MKVVAQRNSRSDVSVETYSLLNEKTFRANIAQWCMCTTYDHWFVCSSLTFIT